MIGDDHGTIKPGESDRALFFCIGSDSRKSHYFAIMNEDDHYNFDKPVNNMINAFKARASWGFFDFRKRGETLVKGDSTFKAGYQSIPVD